MAKETRKDPKGIVLKKGESYRKDGRYAFTWVNSRGERKVKYRKTLQELRKLEKKIAYDMEDGIDTSAADAMTVNQMWDRYINQKYDLRESTKVNYIDTYDRYIRNTFGRVKINTVKYTDVKKYYYSLVTERGLSPRSVEKVHTDLHPTFNLAIREGFIRTNPTDGVMKELKKSKEWTKTKKFALTIPQQKALVNFLEKSTEYNGWYPIIVVLLGTGMRIGECIGLRWEDIDFENGFISVNHNLTYRPNLEGKSVYKIDDTKTEAGVRDIPIIDEVREAFFMEYEIQKCLGFCTQEIDGYSGFVFAASTGNVHLPSSINDAINRITEAYNKEETELAKQEKREALLLPHFSCHILRHTFCTRLCENESNLKVIQTIMGHSDIQTTMNIYAECTKEKKQESITSLSGKIIVK